MYICDYFRGIWSGSQRIHTLICDLKLRVFSSHGRIRTKGNIKLISSSQFCYCLLLQSLYKFFALIILVLLKLKEPSSVTFHPPAGWPIYQLCLPFLCDCSPRKLPGWTSSSGIHTFSPLSILVKMVSIGIWGLWLSCRLRQQTLFDLLSCRPIKNYN